MDYDVIIVGGGPSGLTAGIYAARRKLSVLLVERGFCGGQMQYATELGNWPGMKLTSGQELSSQMEEHAKSVGVELLMDEVIDLDLRGDVKKVKTRKKTYDSKAVILALGGQHRKLNVKGEDAFIGKGVSYCATCDGPFFKGKDVAVVGGGNGAVEEAIYMSELARKVYLIHAEPKLSAEELLQDRLKEKKVKLMLNSKVEEIAGGQFVEKILTSSSGAKAELKVEGVFISIGHVPSIQLAKKAGVQLDERGFIKVDKSMRTNISGVYAAGDVTGSIPQVVVATGGGATAALEAYKHVKK